MDLATEAKDELHPLETAPDRSTYLDEVANTGWIRAKGTWLPLDEEDYTVVHKTVDGTLMKGVAFTGEYEKYEHRAA